MTDNQNSQDLKAFIDYINALVSQGYTLDQVKGTLKSKNYDSKTINSSIAAYIAGKGDELQSYINSQLKAGYTLQQIRQVLVQYKYDYRVVDDAVKKAHNLVKEIEKQKLIAEKNVKQNNPNIAQFPLNNNVQNTVFNQSQTDVSVLQSDVQVQNTSVQKNQFQNQISSGAVDVNQQALNAQYARDQKAYQQQLKKQQDEYKKAKIAQEKLALEQEKNKLKNYESQLKSTAQQYLNQGYSLENIQSILTSQGYDPSLVTKIINSFHQSHFHISKASAFLMLLLIVVGGFAGLYATGNLDSVFSSLTGGKSQSRLMGLELIDLDLDFVYPGDDYTFKLQALNEGRLKGYDVFFEYYIKDSAGNKHSTRKFSKALETTLVDVKDISIPSDFEPGFYTLEATADYGGSSLAYASMRFRVYDLDKDDESPVVDPNPIIPDEPEDYSDNNYIDNPIINNTKPIYDAGDSIYEVDYGSGYGYIRKTMTDQEINNIKKLATSDPNRAVFECKKLESETAWYDCISLVVEETSDIEYCSEFTIDAYYDACKMITIDEVTDKSFCDELKTSRSQKSCKIAIQLNKYRSAYDLNNYKDVSDYLAEIPNNE